MWKGEERRVTGREARGRVARAARLMWQWKSKIERSAKMYSHCSGRKTDGVLRVNSKSR